MNRSTSPAARTPLGLEADLSGGGRFSASDARGRPLLLWVFATWCLPCQAALPRVQKLASDYRGRATIVGLALDREGEKLVRVYRETLEVTFPIALASEDIQSGASVLGRLAEIPAIFVFDARGRFVARFADPRDPDFGRALNELLDSR